MGEQAMGGLPSATPVDLAGQSAKSNAYVDATIAAVPIDAWTDIVTQAVADAKAGDAVARPWLSKVLGIDAWHKLGDDDSQGEREQTIKVVFDERWYGNNAHELARGQ